MAQQPLVGQALILSRLAITLRRTTPGRTLLDKWLDRRKTLPHNTQPPGTDIGDLERSERSILAIERLQTHALDRAVTGIGTS